MSVVRSATPVRTSVKHYGATLVAAAPSVPVAPATPRRNYLLIAVRGINPIAVRFGQPTDGINDLVISTLMIWDNTVPIDSVNISSPLGSSAIIIEGTDPTPGTA